MARRSASRWTLTPPRSWKTCTTQSGPPAAAGRRSPGSSTRALPRSFSLYWRIERKELAHRARHPLLDLGRNSRPEGQREHLAGSGFRDRILRPQARVRRKLVDRLRIVDGGVDPAFRQKGSQRVSPAAGHAHGELMIDVPRTG